MATKRAGDEAGGENGHSASNGDGPADAKKPKNVRKRSARFLKKIVLATKLNEKKP